MKPPEVSIPVSIIDIAVSRLTPIQCKKLLAAILSMAYGTEGPEDIDASTGIVIDMYYDHHLAIEAKRKSVSKSRRASANARWSRKSEPEPALTEPTPVPNVVQVEEVIPEPIVSKPSFVPNNRFLEQSPIKSQFLHWIDYKKKRRSPYNTQLSYEACHTKLLRLSGGSPAIAAEIVEESIANSYLGLFPLKNQNYGPNTKFERQVRAQQQLVDSVAQNCADNIQREQYSQGGSGKGEFVPPTI